MFHIAYVFRELEKAAGTQTPLYQPSPIFAADGKLAWKTDSEIRPHLNSSFFLLQGHTWIFHASVQPDDSFYHKLSSIQ